MFQNSTVLFSGYSKLPAGTASNEVVNVVGLVLLIDIDTGEILKVECTLPTCLSEKFMSELLIGQNMRQGVDELVNRVNDFYQGNAQKSIITAIHIITDKYRSFLERKIKKCYF